MEELICSSIVQEGQAYRKLREVSEDQSTDPWRELTFRHLSGGGRKQW